MAVLDGLLPPDWPDAWCDFARMFFCGLLASKELEAPRDVTARTAIEQVLTAVHQIGGQQLYLPLGTKLSHQAMARSIRRDFTGNNHAELAACHGVTVMRVRQIVGAAAKAPSQAHEAPQKRAKTEIRSMSAASPFSGL